MKPPWSPLKRGAVDTIELTPLQYKSGYVYIG